MEQGGDSASSSWGISASAGVLATAGGTKAAVVPGGPRRPPISGGSPPTSSGGGGGSGGTPARLLSVPSASEGDDPQEPTLDTPAQKEPHNQQKMLRQAPSTPSHMSFCHVTLSCPRHGVALTFIHGRTPHGDRVITFCPRVMAYTRPA